MRRLHRGAGLAFGAVLWWGWWGCAANDAKSEDEAEESPDDPPVAPSIELAVPELELSADQVGEILVPVADLRSDTRVVIDGQAFLPSAAAPATMTDEELRIVLGGAMVVGAHELHLRHQVGSEVLASETVAISIVESDPGGLAATVMPEVVGVGDRLVGHGQGPEAMFGVLDLAAGRIAVRAGQWSAAGFELELPQLHASEGLRAPVDVAIATTAPNRWVVVAYLAADGSQVRARIAPVDVYGAPTAEPSEPLLLWSLDDPEQIDALGPHELARIDGVALLDRMVVIAIEARRDAERASIGDHLLATRLLAADQTAAAPILLRGPDSRDLDLPAEARLWTMGPSAALSVRIGLGFAGLLELGSNGLPLLRGDSPENHAVPSASTWMASAQAAFGSRHVFALAEADATPRVHVLRLNLWSTPDPEQVVSEAIELPAWPTGEPKLAIFDGVPTLVLPMGGELDVAAVRSTGRALRLDSIPELRCDELALANPGNDGIADTLPLACRLGGEVRLGFVRSQ